MLGYLLLALGGLLFGSMVYRYDMHEREPWWMLVCAVVAGALMMMVAFFLEDLFEAILIDAGPNLNYRFGKSLLAGLIEEPAKLVVPAAILLLIKRYFNDPMDGIIYGSLAGLGAALYESLWYSVFVHESADTSLLHEQGSNAMRLLMHTVWGGIGAFALGMIVMKKPWHKKLLQCMGMVMLMHFTWNYFLGFIDPDQQTAGPRVVAAGLIAASVVWYGILVIRANKWSRQMHAPNSKQKLVGKILKALITRKIR